MKVKFIVILITLASCSLKMNAQVSLILENQTVKEGDIFTADLRASDFKDIVSMQFSLNWNKEEIRLIGVENYGLSDMNESGFGLFEDHLTVRWIDLALEGITVEDSTTLFTVKFKAVAVKDSSMLAITGDPTVIELYYANETEAEVNAGSGIITILDETATSTTALDKIVPLELHENQPNPFNEETIIPIDSNRPQSAELKVFDQDGKTIKTIKLHLSTGRNLIELNSSMFPETGTYYYQLLTDYYATTKKLVLIH